MTDYKLLIKNSSGVLQDEVTDFLNLSYVKVVNEPGILNFTLLGYDPTISYLVNDAQIEVWRRDLNNGIDWYCDFYSLFKDNIQSYTESKSLYQGTAIGQLSLLGRRIIAWKAGTLNKSKFTSDPAETIMKALVQYNATSLATTGNGRIRNGAISTITVESDSGGGNTLDWYCAYDNLLENLQKLALVGGGDFDLVKTGSQNWEFRFYSGQLGTDRTSTVLFALNRGNMAEPVYTKTLSGEKTVAIVGGQGEDTDRETVVRTGDNYSSSNDIEIFVDARDVEAGNTSGLNAKGDKELEAQKAQDSFEFSVLQTPASMYGKHYFVGDLVTAQYLDITATPKIKSATITLDRDKRETISIGLETV